MAAEHLCIMRILVSLCFLGNGRALNLEYTIDEELPVPVYIATISDDKYFENYTETELRSLTFTLLKEGNAHAAYFDVNETSSQISIVKRIDRDNLTNCEFSVTCSLDIVVSARMSNGGSFYKTIKIKFFIKDVNDNRPTFSENVTIVQFQETPNGGASVSLDGAVDRDSGIFSVQRYRITPSDVPFNASIERFRDGGNEVKITVTAPLDRELKDRYFIQITAEDGGQPPKTDILDVIVIVLDVNDNPPKFSKDPYNVTLNEDVELGTSFLQVNATDADVGENAMVRYSLSDRQSEDILKQFQINETSGVMSVIKQLVFRNGEILKVIVEATDGNAITQVEVLVNILDSSNTPPIINVDILSGSISEYTDVGYVVAHVSVNDDDTGRNGQIDCYVSGEGKFGIQKLEGKEYKVIVRETLNRELQDRYYVTTVCHDNAVSPLSSNSSFYVNITDENDNPPRFDTTVYRVSHEENNAIGDVVATVSANDLDIGLNGEVKYTLVSTGYNFSINSSSGQIQAYFQMDRETKALYQITVTAVDGSYPRYSANTTVLLTVSDQNDNIPIFSLPVYEFLALENEPIDTFLGNVSANDDDAGENGTLTYSFDFVPTSEFPFVLYSSGRLATIKQLDRETKAEYQFNVKVSDNGKFPLSSSVSVRVNLLDVNDNSPEFIFPVKDNNSVTISFYSNVGDRVARLDAVDLDKDSNAEISYSIFGNNTKTKEIFEVESFTGVLRLRRQLSSSDSLTYTFVVKAEDHGSRNLSSLETLTVLFSKDMYSRPSDLGQNMYIAIILGTVTALLSVAILVLIFCILKRSNLHSNKYFQNMHEKTPTDISDGFVTENKDLNSELYSTDHNSNFDQKTPTRDHPAQPGNSPLCQVSEGFFEFPDNSVSDQDVYLTAHNHEPRDHKTSDTEVASYPHADFSLQWTGQHDQTRPLCKEIMKQNEDKLSESSEETTCDSGRGGSVSDVHTSTFDGDNIKSVKFADTQQVYHISTEQDWRNPSGFSLKHSRNEMQKATFSSVQSRNANINRHILDQKCRREVNMCPLGSNQSGLGISYEEDDDTTTSGSYVIDHEDFNTDYTRSHDPGQEAFC